jgi:hypothetical protein
MFNLISHRRILTVVPNAECKEPSTRDRLPARRRRRDSKRNSFQTRSPSILCRGRFALQKSTIVELIWCSNTTGSAILRATAVLPLIGPESRYGVLNFPSQKNSHGTNVCTRSEVTLRRILLKNIIKMAGQIPPILKRNQHPNSVRIYI